jgi:two-component system, NtrC family, response regulator HydG
VVTPPARLDCRFLHLLLDAMADGAFTLDVEGRITAWNRSMERISGFRAEDAIGKTCGILGFNRCFGRKCPTGVGECGIFEHGAVDHKECMLRHKDGHNVSVLKNARVVEDEDGTRLGVIETVTDLTEIERARRRAEEADRRLAERHRFGNIVGKSHAMQTVYEAIRAAAASEATVLIQGDSGTGKELVAGAIHYNGDRADGPLITVNCSALPESLLESELFGHVRGAFTGAVRDRVGRFEAANGGTLFLDEIAEISPLIQVKLLRALQERRIERVGESRSRTVDIRIIAATHRDLYEWVRDGRFREDLYYRLKVFPIRLPPLRHRKEDIPLLMDHFIGRLRKKTGKAIRSASPQAMRICMDYPWPGNIRELENAVEHAFVLCEAAQIDLFDLPVEIRRMAFRPAAASETEPKGAAPTRDSLNRDELVALLETCDWNKAEAARRLGVSRTAVWKYMKKWEIPLKRPASDDQSAGSIRTSSAKL